MQVKNTLASQDPFAFPHEVGHFAWRNVLNVEDRLQFLDEAARSVAGEGGKPLKERQAQTAENLQEDQGTTINVADNFQEYFAEQFSQWYYGEITPSKDLDTMFAKVADYMKKVIERLKSKKIY